MRTSWHAYLLLISATLCTAFRIHPNIQNFIQAFSISLDDYLPPTYTPDRSHELLKRQYSNTCPTHFSACSNLGASDLCCASGAVCSADAAGHVACCPIGAACSGTIAGVITAGTVNSLGSLISGSATTTLDGQGTSSFVNAITATTTSNGLVNASPTSGNGFVIDGTSTVATPGAAMRGAEIVSHCGRYCDLTAVVLTNVQPLVARAIIRILEYLPI